MVMVLMEAEMIRVCSLCWGLIPDMGLMDCEMKNVFKSDADFLV